MSKIISGTKEWSVASVNCVTGCEHDCRYCYARARALRFHQIATSQDWSQSRIRPQEVRKKRKLLAGTVMFPTTHDITPFTLDASMEVLSKLLRSGNRVLIVSKPHLDCVRVMCEELSPFRPQIVYRFTIGACDDRILLYWEPGAPSFSERLASLRHAHVCGFATSVSCEPLLDAPRVPELFDRLTPHVTDTIWIGKLNRIRERVVAGTDPAEIARIEAGQTDAAVRSIYQQLHVVRKIRWKESYKQALGLPLSQCAGEDL